MYVKATVLCENYIMSNIGAIAEHGWAVHLETKYGNFLFDTGQGKGLKSNADAFKIDLSKVKGIMLSHHHVDHTGGVLQAVIATGPVAVYSHPDLFKPHAYVIRQGKKKNAGIPFTREQLEQQGAEFRFSRAWMEIAPGMYLTGEIPRISNFEAVEKALQTQNEAGEMIPDPMLDDLALVLDTPKGLMIVLGCAHSGIINTIEYVIEQTGKTTIQAVIGGTHLWPVSEEQREKTIEALLGYDIARLGVSHCTGLTPAMRLSQVFRERFFFCNVGSVVEI